MRRRSWGAEVEHSYWPAFADMMSATVLVLFFAAMVSFVQSIAGAKLSVTGTEQVQIIFEERAQTTDMLLKAIGEGYVEVGDNATLRFKADVLFAYDSDVLREEAKPMLREVGTRLAQILGNDTYREAISSIMVEGHTAGPPEDPEYYHWMLGARRAARVLDYFQATNPSLRTPELASYFGAASFSYYRPVDHDVAVGRCRGDDQCGKYRRIEMRVVLKDDKLQAEIMRALGVEQ